MFYCILSRLQPGKEPTESFVELCAPVGLVSSVSLCTLINSWNALAFVPKDLPVHDVYNLYQNGVQFLPQTSVKMPLRKIKCQLCVI